MEGDEPDSKRSRLPPSCASAPGCGPTADSEPPGACWPSSATLYANGLEGRAQALPTSNFTVDASWRAQHFNRADPRGDELKQRQAAARKAMLQRR
jgi:hypothetical protein